MGTILEGRGKEYSEVAREMEQTLARWLRASNISERELLDRIDGDFFDLSFFRDLNSAQIALVDDEGAIGMSFLWWKGHGVDYKNYKTNAALLLFVLASKCRNPVSKKKIEYFIKSQLREKSVE